MRCFAWPIEFLLLCADIAQFGFIHNLKFDGGYHRKGKSKVKHASSAWLTLNPDAAAVSFHNTTTDSQPQSTARHIYSMVSIQTIETLENLLTLFLRYFWAVITYSD